MWWLSIFLSIWLGLKADWIKLFGLGILVDLIQGSRLGQNSLIFLIVGLLSFLIKQWLPKKSRAVKLKL